MARTRSALNTTAANEEQQGSLNLSNPPSQAQVTREARSKPEGKFRLYYLRFTTNNEPAVLVNRDAADKLPQNRTKSDYRYFSQVAIKCKDYIGDAFGLTEIPETDRNKLVTTPYANLTATGSATGKADGRGFVRADDDLILIPKVGTSYGIIFKGQIEQPALKNAPGAEPIKGNVVKVRVPTIVRAYHMINALNNAANVSSAARASIVGIVLPGGRRLQWGDLDQTQIDG